MGSRHQQPWHWHDTTRLLGGLRTKQSEAQSISQEEFEGLQRVLEYLRSPDTHTTKGQHQQLLSLLQFGLSWSCLKVVSYVERWPAPLHSIRQIMSCSLLMDCLHHILQLPGVQAIMNPASGECKAILTIVGQACQSVLVALENYDHPRQLERRQSMPKWQAVEVDNSLNHLGFSLLRVRQTLMRAMACACEDGAQLPFEVRLQQVSRLAECTLVYWPASRFSTGNEDGSNADQDMRSSRAKAGPRSDSGYIVHGNSRVLRLRMLHPVDALPVVLPVAQQTSCNIAAVLARLQMPPALRPQLQRTTKLKLVLTNRSVLTLLLVLLACEAKQQHQQLGGKSQLSGQQSQSRVPSQQGPLHKHKQQRRQLLTPLLAHDIPEYHQLLLQQYSLQGEVDVAQMEQKHMCSHHRPFTLQERADLLTHTASNAAAVMKWIVAAQAKQTGSSGTSKQPQQQQHDAFLPADHWLPLVHLLVELVLLVPTAAMACSCLTMLKCLLQHLDRLIEQEDLFSGSSSSSDGSVAGHASSSCDIVEMAKDVISDMPEPVLLLLGPAVYCCAEQARSVTQRRECMKLWAGVLKLVGVRNVYNALAGPISRQPYASSVLCEAAIRLQPRFAAGPDKPPGTAAVDMQPAGTLLAVVAQSIIATQNAEPDSCTCMHLISLCDAPDVSDYELILPSVAEAVTKAEALSHMKQLQVQWASLLATCLKNIVAAESAGDCHWAAVTAGCTAAIAAAKHLATLQVADSTAAEEQRRRKQEWRHQETKRELCENIAHWKTHGCPLSVPAGGMTKLVMDFAQQELQMRQMQQQQQEDKPAPAVQQCSSRSSGDDSNDSSSSYVMGDNEVVVACIGLIARAVHWLGDVLIDALGHACLDDTCHADDFYTAGVELWENWVEANKYVYVEPLPGDVVEHLQGMGFSRKAEYTSVDRLAAAAMIASLLDSPLDFLETAACGLQWCLLQLQLNAEQWRLPAQMASQMAAQTDDVYQAVVSASKLSRNILRPSSSTDGASNSGHDNNSGSSANRSEPDIYKLMTAVNKLAQKHGSSLGYRMQQWAQDIITQLPSRCFCSNPRCLSLDKLSELQLVGSKGCVCGGCAAAGQVVRYCGVDCQRQHWRKHHPVCRRLRQLSGSTDNL